MNTALRGETAIDLLTVILGHAALLDAALPADDDRRRDVAAIAAAARRLAAAHPSASQGESREPIPT